MELLLATSNEHKAQEFNQLFDPKLITIKPAPLKLDVDEAGSTYFENAFLKAAAYYEKFRTPVLADDSGLNVASMPSELGIYSARFGGEGLTDKARALLLLEKLAKMGATDRSAYFTCVLCFYLAPNEVFYFEGRLSGRVAHSYRGTDGFGYDPVFIPRMKETDSTDSSELTVAELPDWKNHHSHRALAVKGASKFFNEKLLPK